VVAGLAWLKNSQVRVSSSAMASYCVFAHDAVRYLTGEGRAARRPADGMLEWRLAGHPVEIGDA
jgi:hypothetical protein